MKLNYKIIGGVVAGLALAGAGAVFAQPGASMGYGMAGPMGAGMGPGYGMAGGMPGANGAAIAANRLTELKAELKIAPTQEASWLTFENVTKQQAAAMQALRSQMQAQVQSQPPGATAVDYAAQRNAMLAQRNANQATHIAAMKDLYAVLTPEQKVVADQRLTAMGGRHGAHRRWAN